jgi:molecular chaperone DnaK
MSGIIGIDLGTTNSAASFMEDGEARVIPNDRGSRLTPSIVAFTESGELLVGEAAKNQAMINAEATIRSVKRKMGSTEMLALRGKTYTPQELSAFILKKIKRDSEEFFGSEVRDAVISVPAYFTEKQRRATQEAGRLAGLTVRRIINEPTAAALAYAATVTENRHVLVYDLGGGTFDVTVLRSDGKTFSVLSTCGDNRLGGDDFDRILFDKISKEFTEKSGMDIGGDPILSQQLMEQVERAKIELSSRESALVALPFIGGDRKAVHLSHSLNRSELNDLIRPLIERTIDLSRQAVREAEVEIDTLIFSGGSSRIPLVHELMEEEFHVPPEGRINPDEVVARGSAVQASLLEAEDSGRENVLSFRDVTPLPLGVEIEGGNFQCVVKKNTPVPAEGRQIFTTIADKQQSVEVHVIQGLEKTASENTSLGRFLLSGIREAARGEPKIEVTFKIDVDGILRVFARDLETGVKQSVTISREKGTDEEFLSDETIRMNLQSLIQRVKEMGETSQSDIDGRFKRDIRAILKEAEGTLEKKRREDMLESKVALETVIAECTSLREAQEIGFGRA